MAVLEIEDNEILAEEPPDRLDIVPEISGAGVGNRDEWGLLPRMRAYCDEYLACGNMTLAAIVAGYTPRNADDSAQKLMKNSKVRRYLAFQQAKLRRDRWQRQQRLLDELEILSHSDIEVYRRGPGKTLTVKPGVDPVHTRAVSKLKIKSKRYTDEKGREVSEDEMDIGLHSKTAAIDMYNKHLGMYPQQGSRLEIEDVEGNTLVIEEVME